MKFFVQEDQGPLVNFESSVDGTLLGAEDADAVGGRMGSPAPGCGLLFGCWAGRWSFGCWRTHGALVVGALAVGALVVGALAVVSVPAVLDCCY